MWILLKLLRKKKFSTLFFSFLGIVCLVILAFTLFVAFYVSNNNIAYIVLKNKASTSIAQLKKSAVVHETKGGDSYELSPLTLGNDGERGNGLNLLLINNINTNFYVKELLELYVDSANGKLGDTADTLHLEALLGKHYNEAGVYDGTFILRSLLPYDRKTKVIHWNKARGEYPAEAFTLRKLNKNVVATNADGSVGFNETGLHGGSYRNVFQVHYSYFGNNSKASINGYLESSSRVSDMFYLPDSLHYVNNHFSAMVDRYSTLNVDDNVKAGMYSVYHNGGPGHLDYYMSFGVSGPSMLKYSHMGSKRPPESDKSFYDVQTSTPVSDIYSRGSSYIKAGKNLNSVSKGYGIAIWLMLEEGYKLYPDTVDYYRRAGWIPQISAGYKAIYGESLSNSKIIERLEEYEIYPWEDVSGYITRSEFMSVYGDVTSRTDLYINKGMLYKFESYTSDIYVNKVNGSDPLVLHRTHLEAMGQAYDTMFRGSYIYGQMLYYAGVGIDPTNPDTYFNNSNEFIPSGNDFSRILAKIGVTNISKEAYDMLEYGYNISGFWYYLGGRGLPVSQDSWRTHAGFRYSSSSTSVAKKGEISNRTLTRVIYKTKDGTNPEDSPHNRRDENLVNLGKLLLDCSELIAQAYNNTIGKVTGTRVPAYSNSLYTSDQLRTLSDWNDVQAGDIFVREGHVFFYLSNNLTGTQQQLPVSDNLTEKSQIARNGAYWVLEAHDYDTRVGIRTRSFIDKDKYILRRFNELSK